MFYLSRRNIARNLITHWAKTFDFKGMEMAAMCLTCNGAKARAHNNKQMLTRQSPWLYASNLAARHILDYILHQP